MSPSRRFSFPSDGGTTWFWPVTLFVTAVFFVIEHNANMSIQIMRQSNAEAWASGAIASIAEGDLSRRLGYALFGALGVALGGLLRHRYRIGLRGVAGWALLGFLAWSVSSVLWAENPSLVTRRLVVLGLMVVGSAGLLTQFGPVQIIRLMTYSALLYALAGIGLEIFHGTFRPWTAGYRFAGSLHPNSQGVNLSILALGAVSLIRLRDPNRALMWVALGLAAVLIVLTKARSATVACLGVVLLFLVLHNLRLRSVGLLLALAVTSIAAVYLVTSGLLETPWGLILMGRQGEESAMTLSGRLPLWEFLWGYVRERPWVGFGYGGFLSASRAAEIATLVVAFGINGTHSLYLEILLGVGAIGLGLFLLGIGAAMISAAVTSTRDGSPVAAFFACILCFSLIYGVMDSSHVAPNPDLVVVLPLAFVALCRLPGHVPQPARRQRSYARIG